MVGESNYTECVVKRKSGAAGEILLKSLLVFLCLVCIAVALLLNGILQFVGFALLIAACFFTFNMWPKFRKEFEYIFVDGQIDIDVMYSGSTRKHLKRFDMDKIEIVAPVDSHSLDGYKHMNLKPLDYTSKMGLNDVYAIILKGEKEPEKILIEPDDNFLTYMKKKSPRKVEYTLQKKPVEN
ncbi:MAG: hypothetical protein J5643_09415 [Lachnospiraceae bacterium]|nr:hypothetical protein [Lachnospiraceae bacterium]